jgi:hypothetical protein
VLQERSTVQWSHNLLRAARSCAFRVFTVPLQIWVKRHALHCQHRCDGCAPLLLQGLCHLAYGLARMRVKMPTRFRERLLDAAWRLMQQQAGQAADQQQHHSDWGSRGPQAAWQPGSEHQQHRQPLPMSAQSLVQLLWALVKDGRSPHPRWVAACLHQVRGLLCTNRSTCVAPAVPCCHMQQMHMAYSAPN